MYLNKGEGDRVCSPSTEDEIKKTSLQTITKFCLFTKNPVIELS